VTGGSAVVATTGPGSLRSWSLRETAGAVASWRLRDGTTAAGPIIACGNLVSGGADTTTYYDAAFRTGLYWEVVAGAIEGVVVVE
jgi:hypothetical protein